MSDIVDFPVVIKYFLDVDKLRLTGASSCVHESWLDSFSTPFTGTNPDRFLYFGNEYFAIADASGFCSG